MSDQPKPDILERLRYCAGPWSDFTLAEDAKKEIERLRAALDVVAGGGSPNHPMAYPDQMACAADTIRNFMEVARKALGRPS